MRRFAFARVVRRRPVALPHERHPDGWDHRALHHLWNIELLVPVVASAAAATAEEDTASVDSGEDDPDVDADDIGDKWYREGISAPDARYEDRVAAACGAGIAIGLPTSVFDWLRPRPGIHARNTPTRGTH